MLFGLPFLAVGLGVGGVAVSTVWKARAAHRWTPTPMTLVAVQFEEDSDSDSTTYRVLATYTYEIGGRAYTGHRVGLIGGSDSSRGFHERRYRDLAGYRDRGEPFPGFVDARNPERALLYRDIRWGMVGVMLLFAALFGGAGAATIGAAVAGARRARRRAATEAAHPAEPWKWRPDWAAGEVRSSSRAALLGVSLFALFWNLVTAPALFAAWPKLLEAPRPAMLVMLVFPAAGVALLAAAAYQFARWRKYGNPVFRMAAVPGVVGGPLAGVIRVPAHVTPADGFRVTLRCVERVTTGSGKNRHTSDRELWQAERTISRELLANDPTQSAIPVLFGIPFDARESGQAAGAWPVIWRLEASAATPGIDFRASFDVPVFRTAASSPDYRLDERAIAPYVRPPDRGAELSAARIRRELRAGDTVVFHLGMARAPGMAAATTVFCAAWWGVVWLLFHFRAPWLFRGVFGLFGVLAGWGALAAWFHTRTIEVSRGALTFRGGLFGLGRARRYEASAIEGFAISAGGSAGNRTYYTLDVRPAEGRARTLAGLLPGRPAAEALEAEIRAALGPVGGGKAPAASSAELDGPEGIG
jgi:hypothetical protein